MNYITFKRFTGKAIYGDADIKVGSICDTEGRYITYKSKRVCKITSANAHEYFMRNDDGQGMLRGELINTIKNTLAEHPEKWELVEKDGICAAYRNPDHSDVWIWNHAFYVTSIDSLQYIANLVGGEDE